MQECKISADKYLLGRLAEGDKQAYEEIFTRYYATLCAYTRLYIRDLDVGENIVQDLMLWIWENRATLCIINSLSAYLFNATRNRCLKHLNHEMVERRALGQLYEKLQDHFESPDFYIVEELQDKILAAVESLPSSYREVFELHRFQHKSYEEIASQLKVSVKTVDYRIVQSLKILRVRLKDFLPLVFCSFFISLK
nr:MAG TPA: RNA polymerase sigma-70 factor [Caudoviricetes sp.]